MPSTKQTVETAPVDQFVLTESNLREWLCGPIERYYSELEKARQQMVQNKIPESIIRAHFYYDPENIQLQHHYNFLEKIINPKTGLFWTVDNLSNDITSEQADAIRSQDDYKERPFYYIYQIRKVLDAKGKTWITAAFLVEGLTRGVEEIGNTGLTINDSGILGIDKLPRLGGRSVSSDPTGDNKNAKYVQVTTFNGLIPAGTFDQGIVRYTIPWSADTVNQLLKHSVENVGLSFHKEGVSNSVGASSIEQFISEDVETMFKREADYAARKNQPNFTMNDFDDYLRYREEQAKKRNGGDNGEPYV
jgi:hypothetical protein